MSGTQEARSAQYQPATPGSEALHQVLLSHLETFLARVARDPSTPSMPPHVERSSVPTWIAAITSGEAIAKILDHLNLPNLALEPSPARAPPQAEFEFEGC